MKLTHHSQIVARCVLALAALCAFTSRVEAGPPEEVKEAETAMRAGDVAASMSLLRKAADQNYAPAQSALGDILAAAEFYPEALVLYRKAAEQGDGGGEFGLGRMHANGYGVPKDPVLALEWYRKAEKKNNAAALDALARAYRSGDLGLTKDLEQAGALDARVRGIRAAQARDVR